MKRITFSVCFMLLGLISSVYADEPIGVFANLNTNCIQYIDPSTNTVSTQLLKGELGTYGGGLLDVVITSDGKTAIVSNFGDGKIFFIDISGGFNAAPTLLGHTPLTFFAEDMVITPDDKYVLVTDGDFFFSIGVVDIATRTLVFVKDLGFLEAQGIAIAITPDGQLVLVADFWGGAIHSFTLDSNGILRYKETQIVLPFWPGNIAISPDGKTVIVVNAFRSVAPVFYIDSQNDLVFREYISLPAHAGHSCIFSSDGTRAYYQTNSLEQGTQVHILNVTGPGQVSASGTSITIFPPRGSGGFFGVDTIALDPSENYLYLTNPTEFGGVSGIAVIDLTTNTQVSSLKGTGIPVGIAFTTITSDGE
jgi:DNA-binding beta-propeller fold protein YncE